MTDPIAPGSWVEIGRIVLQAGARAPQVPEDTQRVPLEMRVKGFLVAPAAVGEQAEIMTQAGRRLKGVLYDARPAYDHGFGEPIAELLQIAEEVKRGLQT
jgi:hypothetical protein